MNDERRGGGRSNQQESNYTQARQLPGGRSCKQPDPKRKARLHGRQASRTLSCTRQQCTTQHIADKPESQRRPPCTTELSRRVTHLSLNKTTYLMQQVTPALGKFTTEAHNRAHRRDKNTGGSRSQVEQIANPSNRAEIRTTGGPSEPRGAQVQQAKSESHTGPERTPRSVNLKRFQTARSKRSAVQNQAEHVRRQNGVQETL